MKSPILSVIVPVYNVEKFLPGCLDSLADQNFKELEIILVNDGSTDKSLHILKEYASMYSAFKIITQKNAGLSAARNTGLKEAKGKYLAFLDSDDFVDPDMYLKLITLAEEYDADLVKCGILLFNNPDKSIKDVRQEAEDLFIIESQNEILKAYLNREINTVVWNGIYKTEILNNIAFPEGANFEDHYFTPLALKNTKKFVYTPEVFCYYRQRSGSITSAKNINSIADKVKSVNTLYDVVIQSNKPHLLAELFAKYFVRMATEYHNALIYNKPAKLRRKQNAICAIINNDVINYVLNEGQLSKRDRIFLSFMMRSHYLYFILQKIARIFDLVFRRQDLSKKHLLSDSVNRTNHYLKIIQKYA